MEQQMDYEKYMKLLSFPFHGNANFIIRESEYDQNQHLLSQPATIENDSNAHSYIKFIAENLAYDPNASFYDAPHEHNEVLNDNSEKALNFEPTFSNMVSWNVMPSLHVPNNTNHEDLIREGPLFPGQNEINGKSLNNFTNQQLRAQQISTMVREHMKKDDYRVHEHQSGVTIAAYPPGVKVPSIPRSSSRASKEKTTETDRLRRLKIAEKLKALQELLPQSNQSISRQASQASVMDDVIEHIKFLQYKMKELSQSKLGGKSTSDPFSSLQRYGHDFKNELTENEAIEDAIGNLLEKNPLPATQLLESRGLWVMPITLAEDLLQEQQQPRMRMMMP